MLSIFVFSYTQMCILDLSMNHHVYGWYKNDIFHNQFVFFSAAFSSDKSCIYYMYVL